MADAHEVPRIYPVLPGCQTLCYSSSAYRVTPDLFICVVSRHPVGWLRLEGYLSALFSQSGADISPRPIRFGMRPGRGRAQRRQSVIITESSLLHLGVRLTKDEAQCLFCALMTLVAFSINTKWPGARRKSACGGWSESCRASTSYQSDRLAYALAAKVMGRIRTAGGGINSRTACYNRFRVFWSACFEMDGLVVCPLRERRR